MGNSDKAKLKLVILYDYFLRNVNAYGEDKSGVKMGELLDYLKAMTDEKFERKSIYSDIKKINEYMQATGRLKIPNDDWIYLEGNSYKRAELVDELSQEEAQLIYDAIRTTPFVNSNICKKIEKLYPAYFKNYHPLLQQNSSISSKLKFTLSSLRKAIEDQNVVKITYAHKFQNGYKGAYDDYISPVALDWEKNCYYLIAVNHKFYGRTSNIQTSIRKYRLDRIVGVDIESSMKYIACDSKLLNSYLEHTVNAFSCWNYWNVRIDMDFEDESALMRAYSALRDELEVDRIYNDLKISSGIMSINVKIPLIENRAGNEEPVPTIYPILLMLYNLPKRKAIKIDNDKVNEGFKKYLESALDGLK